MSYLGDEHAHNCPHHLVYEIDRYIPDSITDDYGMVGIRDKWIEAAITLHKPLVVIAPKGCNTFNPQAVKKEKKTFDQVGLYVDRPMKMYALQIFHGEKKPIEAYQFG